MADGHAGRGADVSKKETDFWPFAISKELREGWKVGKHVITTGTSMSGDPHIGNANDVIRGDAIRLALEMDGASAELVWISDDMDPFRSVPTDMPAEMEDYLGVPAAMIPDFWKDGHSDFIEHFETRFLEQLGRVNVRPRVLRGVDMYRSGMYDASIKTAMSKRGEIAEILNKFKEKKLGPDWYPINVVCEGCNKISTTVIRSYDGGSFEAEYFCNPDQILLHRKNPVSGCGHSGKVSVLGGRAKLTWRVEWPARWSFLGTTCEPFGKEHSSAGGSWDTGKEISEKIFGHKPPYPVVYEHFMVNGDKMSKSKGNVISVDDMLRFMLPEHLRYWMYQGRLTIAKDIVLKDIVPRVFDEFDRAEGAYLDPDSVGDHRERNNLVQAYRLAMSGNLTGVTKENVSHRKFGELKSLLKSDPKKLIALVETLDGRDGDRLNKKLDLVSNWMKEFEKPEEVRPYSGPVNGDALKALIEAIERSQSADSLQSDVFEVAKGSGMKPADFFKMVYGILIGAERGPRLGPYIFERGKEEVIRKLKEAI